MPNPPNVKWKGTQALTRVGRGRWLFSPQEVICVIRYKGPYQTCLTTMPLIGQTITGYTAYGVKVDHAELEEGEGSSGNLTITLRNPNTDVITLQGGSGSAPAQQQSGQAGDSQPGLQWNACQFSIERHPLCGTNTKAGSDGSLSQDNHIPQPNYKAVPGGWTYQQYQSLIQSGYTSYSEPQPVLTLRTQWYTKPTQYGMNNFAVDTPPSDQGLPLPADPIGGGQWVWVRAGDELSRQSNRWEFHQAWTGYRPGSDITLHNLLYGSGTGGGSSSGGS